MLASFDLPIRLKMKYGLSAREEQWSSEEMCFEVCVDECINGTYCWKKKLIAEATKFVGNTEIIRVVKNWNFWEVSRMFSKDCNIKQKWGGKKKSKKLADWKLLNMKENSRQYLVNFQ